MKKPSRKQLAVLDQIRKFIVKHKYPPTVRELAQAVGVSSSCTVHCHLLQLKDKGLIDWEPERPRTIKILPQGGVGHVHN